MNTENVSGAMEIIRLAQASPSKVARSEVSDAIESVVQATAATYSRESERYAQARTSQTWERDVYMTETLLRLVRDRIASGDLSPASHHRWRLLDVGAGYGRDLLRFLQEPDVDPVGVENANGFITALRRLQGSCELGPDAVVMADMRDMSVIPAASFQCVRNHATLHHLPVVGDGLGADAAVSECRRVMTHGGVFYVTVKAGNGVSMIDTSEGLGGRFFQLFTPEMLRDLLGRHALDIVHMEELLEPRSSGEVRWIFSLAVAI